MNKARHFRYLDAPLCNSRTFNPSLTDVREKVTCRNCKAAFETIKPMGKPREAAQKPESQKAPEPKETIEFMTYAELHKWCKENA